MRELLLEDDVALEELPSDAEVELWEYWYKIESMMEVSDMGNTKEGRIFNDIYAGLDDDPSDPPVDYIGEYQQELRIEKLEKEVEELKKRVAALESKAAAPNYHQIYGPGGNR